MNVVAIDNPSARKCPRENSYANDSTGVVVFCGGPGLDHEVKKFLYRLVEHPDITLLGVFCQSRGQTVQAIAMDLWRRRGVLALPLLLMRLGKGTARFLFHIRDEVKLNRKMAQLSDCVHFVANIHAPEVIKQVRSLSPDLGLVYGSPILKPALFEIPKGGTLGIHHGKAPEYRGKKTTFWAMYNGEKTAGVTIQKVNAGLDTGEILKQEEVIIGRRSYRAVCQELERLGIDLYIQAIIEVRNGVAKFSPQIGGDAKLYRDPKYPDIFTFWWRQLRRQLLGF
jgi:folate-dependent phosphoribosylglycinamide formyltransferase PurN